jgi:predicted PurR-regulated permease PerM
MNDPAPPFPFLRRKEPAARPVSCNTRITDFLFSGGEEDYVKVFCHYPISLDIHPPDKICRRTSALTRHGNSPHTMSVTRAFTFWIALLAVATAGAILLREILLPFVAGMALAYLLNPLANRLERFGMNRLIATLAITGLFILVVVVLVVLAAPIIVTELTNFIEHIPVYVRQLRELASDPNRPWLRKVVGEGLGSAEQSIGELTTLGGDWLTAFLRSVWSGGRALFSVFSLSVVTPIIACYLVYNWNRMIAMVDKLVPPGHRETVRALAREIDATISGFVLGQSTICLILSLYYATALSLIGLNHALLIGVAAGLISFVPYLGSLSGLVVSTCVAIAQFWPNRELISLVPAIFFVGQFLADYALSPYLIGRRVNLNPVWLLFALFAFGYLFGFVGLLIAVPLAATIGVLMRFALRQYLASSFYATDATNVGTSTRSREELG